MNHTGAVLRVHFARNRRSGHNVILADAEDADFWNNADLTRLRLVMLAMPTLRDMQQTARLLTDSDYGGAIAAVAKFDDDRAVLEAVGVHATFNFYAEAGAGFAKHVSQQLMENGAGLSDGPIT